MKNLKTYRLTLLGIFTGLIILMTFTPIGYIIIPPIEATIIHIPVIVGAIVLGWQFGAIIGGMMGIFCLLRALVMPALPTDVLFLNPVVSVIPRICIGLVAALVFAGLMKVFKKKSAVPFAAGVAAVAGTLTNTILVLGTLVLFYGQTIQVSLNKAIPFIIGSIFAVNGAIEILSAVVIAVPVSTALLNVQKRLKAE